MWKRKENLTSVIILALIGTILFGSMLVANLIKLF